MLPGGRERVVYVEFQHDRKLAGAPRCWPVDAEVEA
jgi:hypothetical protein